MGRLAVRQRVVGQMVAVHMLMVLASAVLTVYGGLNAPEDGMWAMDDLVERVRPSTCTIMSRGPEYNCGTEDDSRCFDFEVEYGVDERDSSVVSTIVAAGCVGRQKRVEGCAVLADWVWTMSNATVACEYDAADVTHVLVKGVPERMKVKARTMIYVYTPFMCFLQFSTVMLMAVGRSGAWSFRGLCDPRYWFERRLSLRVLRPYTDSDGGRRLFGASLFLKASPPDVLSRRPDWFIQLPEPFQIDTVAELLTASPDNHDLSPYNRLTIAQAEARCPTTIVQPSVSALDHAGEEVLWSGGGRPLSIWMTILLSCCNLMGIGFIIAGAVLYTMPEQANRVMSPYIMASGLAMAGLFSSSMVTTFGTGGGGGGVLQFHVITNKRCITIGVEEPSLLITLSSCACLMSSGRLVGVREISLRELIQLQRRLQTRPTSSRHRLYLLGDRPQLRLQAQGLAPGPEKDIRSAHMALGALTFQCLTEADARAAHGHLNDLLDGILEERVDSSSGAGPVAVPAAPPGAADSPVSVLPSTGQDPPAAAMRASTVAFQYPGLAPAVADAAIPPAAGTGSQFNH